MSSMDMMLDRRASSVQRTPAPGSAQWRSGWDNRDNRDTSDGRALVRQHLLIKIAIARAALINPCMTLLALAGPLRTAARPGRVR